MSRPTSASHEKADGSGCACGQRRGARISVGTTDLAVVCAGKFFFASHRGGIEEAREHDGDGVAAG